MGREVIVGNVRSSYSEVADETWGTERENWGIGVSGNWRIGKRYWVLRVRALLMTFNFYIQHSCFPPLLLPRFALLSHAFFPTSFTHIYQLP